MESFTSSFQECYYPLYNFLIGNEKINKFVVCSRVKHESNSNLSLIITIKPSIDNFNWKLLKIIPYGDYFMIYYGSESTKFDVEHVIFNTSTAETKLDQDNNTLTLTLKSMSNPLYIEGLDKYVQTA
jgi:hypothetical protein